MLCGASIVKWNNNFHEEANETFNNTSMELQTLNAGLEVVKVPLKLLYEDF